MRIRLHIQGNPRDSWVLTYPIIPRVGDRLYHPHSKDILLKVDAVLLHADCLPDSSPDDADVICSETDV